MSLCGSYSIGVRAASISIIFNLFEISINISSASNGI